MASTRETLSRSIDRLDRDIAEHAENVAEAAGLFAAGKLDQAAFDTAIAEREAVVARRAALHGALVAQAAKELQQRAAAIEAERKAAANLAGSLLTQRAQIAQDIQLAAEALFEAGWRSPDSEAWTKQNATTLRSYCGRAMAVLDEANAMVAAQPELFDLMARGLGDHPGAVRTMLAAADRRLKAGRR